MIEIKKDSLGYNREVVTDSEFSERIGKLADTINKARTKDDVINVENGTVNKRATFNLERLEKGAEQELWETLAYEVPALSHQTALLNMAQLQIVNNDSSDKVTIPTVSSVTPEIVRDGASATGSASAFSPSYKEFNTKNYIVARPSITVKQRRSMSFPFLQQMVSITKKECYRYIEKDYQRILALLVPSAHRLERASGDAITLTHLSSAWEYIVQDGANPLNLGMTCDPASMTKIRAIEDTEGRNMFLDYGIYGNKSLESGIIGKINGFDVGLVGDPPGIEDNWSEIEDSESHYGIFFFDKASLVLGINANIEMVELPVVTTPGYQYAMQVFYGGGLVNENHIAALKLYEA